MQGAYVAISNVYDGWGEYYLDIEKDPDTALVLMEKELEAWPDMRTEKLSAYANLLMSLKRQDSARTVVSETAKEVFSRNKAPEKEMVAVYNSYHHQLRPANGRKTTRAGMVHLPILMR